MQARPHLGIARRVDWGAAGPQHAACLLALSLLVASVFLPVVLGSHSVYGLDKYFNPLWESAAWGFASGDWPFWTPHIRAGYPLHANGEASLFYPLTYPLLTNLPAHRALDAFVLLHLVAAGFAMWLYLRELSLAPLVAFLGAVAFALSGRMIASTIWAHAIAASVPLPLLLLGIERIGRIGQGRLHGMLWIALAVALGGLAGRPQRLLPALMLAGGYALCSVLQRRRREPRAIAEIGRDLAAMGVAGCLGLGIAAVQWIPTASFVADSHWGAAVPVELFEQHGLQNADWRGIWLPATAEHRIGTRSYPGIAVYAGLLLALIQLVRGRDRDWRSLFLWAAIPVCLYFASAGPGTHELFGQLPGLRSLRAPVRFLYPACFGMVVLAAIAGSRWLPERSQWVAGAVVGLACLELALVARATAPIAPAEIYRARPSVLDVFEADLQGPDPTGAKPRFVAMGFWVHHDFVASAGRRRLLRRFAELPPTQNLAMRYDLRASLGYGEPQFAWQERLMRAPGRALLDQLGTRLLFLSEPSETFPLLGRHGRAYVHRNPAALPRAVCATRLLAASSSQEAARRAAASDFDSHTMAVLETPALPAIDPAGGAACQIAIRLQTHNRVEIEVESPGRRVLVLFDAWAPGWSARVDSHEVALPRANGMFRAVVVPRGRSLVEFAYRPPGLIAGMALSALAMLVLLILLVLALAGPRAHAPGRRAVRSRGGDQPSSGSTRHSPPRKTA